MRLLSGLLWPVAYCLAPAPFPKSAACSQQAIVADGALAPWRFADADVVIIMEGMSTIERVLIHLTDYRRVPIDPHAVYYLEADGDATLIRTRSARRLRDVRGLGEVLPAYLPHGLVRVHRSYAVNVSRVREIVRREQGEHWQLRLQPPVGKILPIGEKHLRTLWQAYGD